mgnify:CR=1 FL=1
MELSNDLVECHEKVEVKCCLLLLDGNPMNPNIGEVHFSHLEPHHVTELLKHKTHSIITILSMRLLQKIPIIR